MKTKGERPLSGLSGRSPAPLVSAYFELNQLKQLYRQGWLRRGVPPERCETVAEHVLSMALLAWWIADAAFPELDSALVLRLVLVHELGEIYTGDLTPSDQVPPEEKHRREREGLWQVVGKLPNGAEYLALWESYETGATPEARFVKQVDRLEMAFQAGVYQTQGFASMDEFFASAESALQDPRLIEIFNELRRAL